MLNPHVARQAVDNLGVVIHHSCLVYAIGATESALECSGEVEAPLHRLYTPREDRKTMEDLCIAEKDINRSCINMYNMYSSL